MDSYDVLVIILSVTLAIFLILSIVALTIFIQILKKVRETSETTQHAVENVEQFTEQLKNVGKVSSFGAAVNQIAKLFKKGGK